MQNVGRGGGAGLLTERAALGREEVCHWTTPRGLIFATRSQQVVESLVID